MKMTEEQLCCEPKEVASFSYYKTDAIELYGELVKSIQEIKHAIPKRKQELHHSRVDDVRDAQRNFWDVVLDLDDEGIISDDIRDELRDISTKISNATYDNNAYRIRSAVTWDIRDVLKAVRKCIVNYIEGE